MYATREDFERDVFNCNPRYSDRALAGIEIAWNVYQAAMATNLNMLILGRWREPSVEGDPGIDMALKNNFLITNEVFTGGSVMDSANWSVLVNDAFILGGIHAQTEFQLASPRTADNVFDNVNNRLTVTGREIVGLVSYGYEIRRTQQNEIAVCTDIGMVQAATFTDYVRAIGRYSNNNGWQELVDISIL